MTTILGGVRILEVAEHTFVPAASALLADLGTEVIKIEHVTRGDAMRGLASAGVAAVPGDVHALLEHSNRGVLAFTRPQAAKYWPLPDEVFASATLEDWRRRLESFEGQWCVVQDTLQAAEDPQTVANGYLQECRTADGPPFRLVAAPVQYDEAPARPARAPKFNEHGDEILGDLGLDWNAILDLKVRGIVA